MFFSHSLFGAPLPGVVECGEQVDIAFFDAAVESFKLIVVVEEASWLLIVQNFLVAFPESYAVLRGKGSAQLGNDGVEFPVLKGCGVEGATGKVGAPDDELEGECFGGHA